MSQPLGYRVSRPPRPRKRKGPPLPSLPTPARETPLTSEQLTSGIPDEQGTDPPTKQMSQLHIQDIAPPDPLSHKRGSGRLTQATRNASIPTWGQIKTLCHQARGITSLQGSPTSPEKMFIAMLALLSCQISTSSPALKSIGPTSQILQTFKLLPGTMTPYGSTQTSLSYWEGHILLIPQMNILLISILPSGD